MADKIFRVNMSDLSAVVEDVPSEWMGLGGRGLTSTVVAAEVEPTCHPLGVHNKLVIAPGLLSGTPAANSGRLSCGAKSPLTGTIKEANAGGSSAQMLAKLGVKAIIIEGMPKADSWYSLRVSADGVAISEESEVVGKGNYELIQTLNDQFARPSGEPRDPNGAPQVLPTPSGTWGETPHVSDEETRCDRLNSMETNAGKTDISSNSETRNDEP